MAVAQWWVSSTYRRWGQTKNSLGMNGQDAAQRLLAQAGLPGVEVAGAQGRLSDHYDPRTHRLHLSPEVAGVPSVASLAITAHEIGHAMQDRDGYAPLRIRSALVPAASIGSNLGWILLLIGLILAHAERLGVHAVATLDREWRRAKAFHVYTIPSLVRSCRFYAILAILGYRVIGCNEREIDHENRGQNRDRPSCV
jgi:Zn-dependent membrane protease YugP